MLMTVVFMSFKNNKKGLFVLGGAGYGLIEILWRGKTHWSMFLTGGLCFLALFRLFEKAENFSLRVKCLAGGGVITAFEFISGCIFNRLFKLKVWDYSDYRFNFKGQICVLYSFLWTMLCIPVSLLCKKMRRL